LTNHLDADSCIVHFPDFKNAAYFLKFQPPQITDGAEEKEEEPGMSILERMRHRDGHPKRQKTDKTTQVLLHSFTTSSSQDLQLNLLLNGS